MKKARKVRFYKRAQDGFIRPPRTVYDVADLGSKYLRFGRRWMHRRDLVVCVGWWWVVGGVCAGFLTLTLTLTLVPLTLTPTLILTRSCQMTEMSCLSRSLTTPLSSLIATAGEQGRQTPPLQSLDPTAVGLSSSA
jgi:hypothetical protein